MEMDGQTKKPLRFPKRYASSQFRWKAQRPLLVKTFVTPVERPRFRSLRLRFLRVSKPHCIAMPYHSLPISPAETWSLITAARAKRLCDLAPRLWKPSTGATLVSPWVISPLESLLFILDKKIQTSRFQKTVQNPIRTIHEHIICYSSPSHSIFARFG